MGELTRAGRILLAAVLLASGALAHAGFARLRAGDAPTLPRAYTLLEEQAVRRGCVLFTQVSGAPSLEGARAQVRLLEATASQAEGLEASDTRVVGSLETSSGRVFVAAAAALICFPRTSPSPGVVP